MHTLETGAPTLHPDMSHPSQWLPSGVDTTDFLMKSAGTGSCAWDVPPEVPWKVKDTGLAPEVLTASEKLEPVPHESTPKLNTGEERLMNSQGPDGGQLALAQPIMWELHQTHS